MPRARLATHTHSCNFGWNSSSSGRLSLYFLHLRRGTAINHNFTQWNKLCSAPAYHRCRRCCWQNETVSQRAHRIEFEWRIVHCFRFVQKEEFVLAFVFFPPSPTSTNKWYKCLARLFEQRVLFWCSTSLQQSKQMKITLHPIFWRIFPLGSTIHSVFTVQAAASPAPFRLNKTKKNEMFSSHFSFLVSPKADRQRRHRGKGKQRNQGAKNTHKKYEKQFEKGNKWNYRAFSIAANDNPLAFTTTTITNSRQRAASSEQR